MSLIDTLMDLEDKLWKYKMSNTKKTYLSIEEIQEIMRNDRYMPTAIFSATKTDYIVKPRTIHGPKVKSKKKNLF